MSKRPLIHRLCIIGVGLIGGSLARALRQAGAVDQVIGCGRSVDSLQRAEELGVVDHYTTDPARAVAAADMVVVCVPLGAMRGVFEQIRDHLAPEAVVTDGGSAKGSVIEDARAAFGELPAGFVPGHPIAGTEKSGVEASFARLYNQRRVILTPVPESADWAVARTRRMWEAVGARVTCMSAAHHDDVLAATSHLPHALAFGLVDTLSRWEGEHEIFEYAAGGFRDFTRIASSDPVMWRDICLANREALARALRYYTADLAHLTALVEQGDGAALEAIFRHAKERREQFLALLEDKH
ncbi:prephenate dehydrogenase/arogenate dehydrogenase family protein [Alkalilimnicola ehrlichii MLHE-1]|uniref:prephenate dehydrogenase n=1 Tax=Alkalilimnicola ehrlichii (strain ATCC BAA-1101 / DSM 17681 / MLHE-1) TaxID=187272 RepID=Q0AA55_ALKEH|nr:prephenate dehydrogenase/arogenate dehydrogenase family protein [Alkalilimnicola ehrlichii]ABI56282.1 Prephenate dehydrogenase [Alkalilimnicola ehrlichii MLHE-1]